MKNLIIVLALAALTGCCSKKNTDAANTAEKQGTEVSAQAFEILKQETYGGRETESHEVITSQQQLNALYKELNQEATPAIDFSKRQIVALFMGQKTSGGYSIGVKSVAINGDTAIITVTKTSPEGMATSALTQPYCLVSIAKTKNVMVK